MRKTPKNAIAQPRMTNLATNAFLTHGKEKEKIRNSVINNKSKTKIQQAIHTTQCGKLIQKAKDVHLIRLAIKKKITIREKANII